ncbi:peptidase inhibitor family I36 protein [Saccharothrix coeruleofusca]|uniref:Peptidase inhibitor family I36 n=1 Tax=Saccharothrix coeruleofusca TaxID=33919 RepID=A0A918EIT1_9PSEU|nr:peptidase inhibitor family I36 protein [Saccharothrix coeruleofusca]MBP2337045.1 hypothetical protein [Saccharothrix coeruleofusca]GGP86686.1 hypothetical protein GCM10010185_70580 [Saccharothrix coeruleofusca]
MKRLTVLLSAVLLGVAALATPAAASSAPGIAAWENCTTGNACFYSGSGGTGSVCRWSNADPNWLAGTDRCSWAQATSARSVWNRGTSPDFTAVAFYRGTDYTLYEGCMGQGWRGDIGPALLRSHRWITTSC